MIDSLIIQHKSGLTLFSHHSILPPSQPDAFLLLHSPTAQLGGKIWSLFPLNELGLSVAVCSSLVMGPVDHLPLLHKVGGEFVKLFRPELERLHACLSGRRECAVEDWALVFRGGVWGDVFERCLMEFEGEGGRRRVVIDQSRDVSQAVSQSPTQQQQQQQQEKPHPKPKTKSKPKLKPNAKALRKWDGSSVPVTQAEMDQLDFSHHTQPGPSSSAPSSSSSPSSPIPDLSSGLNKMSLSQKPYDLESFSSSLPAPSASASSWSGMLSRLSLSSTLTKEDLSPALAKMKLHLMAKNVASDISDKLCEGAAAAIVGKKIGALSTIKAAIKTAVAETLTRTLTPGTSVDLLRHIQSRSRTRPFVLVLCGVNGVGKSTTLSKFAYWLLKNNLSVLVAACDTFRSGAVEQLKTHVDRLSEVGRVELFEKGYGKDAAGIAKDAIAYATSKSADVVLVDTAGRMQDNEPLMRALGKLVAVNSPDRVLFVGEALVGNEAIDQLTKFDRALKDYSKTANSRGIDGMILTKFDAIDDKVGAAVNMCHVTGMPIVFVGCGQTYTDLKSLQISDIVNSLLAG